MIIGRDKRFRVMTTPIFSFHNHPIISCNYWLLIFLCLFWNNTFAQPKNISQLLSNLKTEVDTSIRINHYNQLVEYYKYENLDSAHIISDLAIFEFNTSKNHRAELGFLARKGDLYHYEGQYRNAEGSYKKAIELSQSKDSFRLELIYGNLSNNFAKLNQMDSTFFYLHKAIDLGPGTDPDRFYRNYYLLGDYQMMAGLTEEAEKSLLIAYNNKNKTSYITHYVTIYYLARLYGIHMKDFDKFAQIQKEIIELKSERGPMTRNQFHYDDIGLSSLPESEQEEIFVGALLANQKMKYNEGIAVALVNLLNFYFDQKEDKNMHEELTRYVEDAELMSSFSLQNQISIYNYFEKIYNKKSDFKKAYELRRVQNILKDSFDLMNDEKLIFELEEKYDAALKDNQLAQQQIEIDKKTNQRNMLLAGGALLLFLGGFMRYRYQKKQQLLEKEKIINQQKISQLEKEKKILSLAAMLEGQEVERTRIAKDLHDGLGGLLSTVKAHFSKIHKEIKNLTSMNVYNKATGMIDEACDEVRRISHNLMPGVLRANGLGSAIEQLANEFRTAHNIEVDCQIINMNERLEETKEVFIYRIFQELANNIIKHSNAKTVLIQLGKYDDEIQLLVEDDGVGFNLDKEIAKEGLGLKSLQSRVDFLNGTMDLDTRPEKGTSISINIPIDEK